MIHFIHAAGRSIRGLRLFPLICCLVAVVAPSLASAQQQETAPLPEGWAELGLKDYGIAPEIKLPLADGTGELKLSELVKYGPVLVDFWATWCGPCRQAMPQYAALYERYRDQGFNVLAVSEDAPAAVDKVREFMRKMELPFPVVLDLNKDAGRAYYIRSLPTAYLIDRRGHVVGVEIGYAPGHEKELAKKIEALLAAEGALGAEG